MVAKMVPMVPKFSVQFNNKSSSLKVIWASISTLCDFKWAITGHLVWFTGPLFFILYVCNFLLFN